MGAVVVVAEFRLLGPVEIRMPGKVLNAGQPRQRLVLAALLVDAGRLVSWDTLIDRVWGETPPMHPRDSLRAHIARLRGMLTRLAGENGTSGQILHDSGGYLIDVAPEQVDLYRFAMLVETARTAEPDQRVDQLRQALRLWRGDPLLGLSGEWVTRMRRSWRQRHIATVAAWADAELEIGNAAVVVAPLTELADEHPLNESLITVLMRALQATNSAAAALQRYDLVRRALQEELGVDPGPELQEIYHRILRNPLDVPAAAPAARPGPGAPAQLPRDVRGFTGRLVELAHLDAMLHAACMRGAPVVISVVVGTAGIGKTALAVHWAHGVADRFPDGQLYADLRGFGPAESVMQPAEAIRKFLDALGVPPQRIPVDLDAQAALYRSELAGRRILVLLDNARDTSQVSPLLPGSSGCMVLVTSRNHLSGLVAADAAHLITLDLLSVADARELLALRLGADRVGAEPDAIEEIIACCARLPLALTILAARATSHPHLPLRTFASELRDASGQLDVLTTDDPSTDVRAVFSWSYRALTPDAARLFRLLSLHPGPDFTAPAAASLTALPLPRVRLLLAELVQGSLVVEHTAGRFTVHDLLRTYATERADEHDTDEQRHAATHRMLDHYLHTTNIAALLLDPPRDLIGLTPAHSGVTPEQLADHEQALAWFTAEHPVLLAAVHHAAATGFDTHAWQLALTLYDYLHRQGHWHDQIAVQRAAVVAAHRLASPIVQARAHRQLALACTRLDRFDEAHTELVHALDLTTQAEDQAGQAHIHFNIAYLCGQRGRHTEALQHARRAHDLYQLANHQRGQARTLNAIGWYHGQLGHYDHALAACRQALVHLQHLDDRHGQAGTWDSLGYAHHHLDHHDQAVTCYQCAVALYREHGDRYGEAETLIHLGDAHHASGNHHAARTAWQRALTVLVQLQHPDAKRIQSKLTALGQR